MKKSFQKSLIAASVGAVMFAAAGTASANSLLFPFFTTASGAQSVLSLSNTGTVPATQTIHYVYNYGAACTHFDANGTLTANDVLSHSIAAPPIGGPAGGFGLVTVDKSTPVYFPLANQTGFLVVSSKTTASVDALRGSMAIVDPTTGLVVSYPGIDNALDTLAAGNEGNYAAITDVNFPLTVLPTGIVSTNWFAVVVGNMSAVIAAGADWKGAGTFTNNGNIWNNDEVAFSGTQTKAVTCQGTVQPGDLATTAQAAAVGANGGLIKTTFTPTSVAPSVATGVIMTKIQTVLPVVGAPFAGKQFLHREQAGL